MATYRSKPARGLRVRESVPAYGEPDALKPIPVYHVVVSDRGRLVLPQEIRERLDIKGGDRISLTLEDDGAVVLQTPIVAIRRLQAMMAPLKRPCVLESDELIKERRREARREERRFKEWDARRRKIGQ